MCNRYRLSVKQRELLARYGIEVEFRADRSFTPAALEELSRGGKEACVRKVRSKLRGRCPCNCSVQIITGCFHRRQSERIEGLLEQQAFIAAAEQAW